jgi:hypothetical protein
MPPTEMVHTGAPLTQAHPSTPPSSPNDSSEHVVTLSSAQQFIEMVTAIVAMQMASSPASKCSCSHVPPENPTFQASPQPLTLEGAKPDAPEAARASKLEYKTVTEVYASNGVVVKHG